MKDAKGFTLIELMIVVAIIGILAMIVLPQYQQYVIRGNRTAAEAFMMDVANREKQYLIDARSYAIDGGTTALAQLSMAPPPDVAKFYTFTVTDPSASTVPAFTVTAAPIAGKLQASDGGLTLDDLGNRGPAGKW
jgi:type IV pilus assembly protein PilE